MNKIVNFNYLVVITNYFKHLKMIIFSISKILIMYDTALIYSQIKADLLRIFVKMYLANQKGCIARIY